MKLKWMEIEPTHLCSALRTKIKTQHLNTPHTHTHAHTANQFISTINKRKMIKLLSSRAYIPLFPISAVRWVLMFS